MLSICHLFNAHGLRRFLFKTVCVCVCVPTTTLSCHSFFSHCLAKQTQSKCRMNPAQANKDSMLLYTELQALKVSLSNADSLLSQTGRCLSPSMSLQASLFVLQSKNMAFHCTIYKPISTSTMLAAVRAK